MNDYDLFRDFFRYIGQTVTIYTKSGGLSGAGFTGVLISVDDRVIRLLADVGAPPSCPVGSACGCGCACGPYMFNGGGNACGGFSPLGAVVTIPTDSVAAFVHNAI